jgi:hypothetical protein
MGLVDQAGGRNRQYCNDAHKTAAYRKRKKEQGRDTILQYNSDLREYWQDSLITGPVLAKLQGILVTHGKDAARAATDAVILARQLERDSGTSECTDLIEQVMMLAEACNFEAVQLEDARIQRFAKSLTRLIPPEALLLDLGVHSHSGKTSHEHHEQ